MSDSRNNMAYFCSSTFISIVLNCISKRRTKKRFGVLKLSFIKKTIWAAGGLLLLTGCCAQKAGGGIASGSGQGIAAADNLPTGLQEDILEITLPGSGKEYTFAVLNDLHLIVENNEISEDKREEVRERIPMFSTGDGTSAVTLWDSLPDTVNTYSADAVLLCGDMVDYASAANLECLDAGLEKLEPEYLYVRADHDYATWYGSLTKDYVKELHRELDGAPATACLDYEDFCILGIDNSTSQISSAALEQIREVFALGKPIILLTHVPLKSLVDDSLQQTSREAWGDRALVWGEDCYYVPNENTAEFLELVYAPDSPVCMVLSGHLHYLWDGLITDRVRQHVFDATFRGTVGIVKVKTEPVNSDT